MRSFILSQWRDLRMGVTDRRFRSFNHTTCKTVPNLLDAVYLRLRKIVVERVTVVVKFRVRLSCYNATANTALSKDDVLCTLLADRTNGRAYATLLRTSSSSAVVCNVMYCG